MAKRRSKRIYRYKCSLTEQEIKVTSEAPQPEELVTVEAYYQLHPEEDDRPESALAQLGIDRDNPFPDAPINDEGDESESDSDVEDTTKE